MKAHACPPPAELARFLERKVSASEARRLRVHVAECESCQEVVSEALAFLEGDAGGEVEEPMEAQPQPHPFPVVDDADLGREGGGGLDRPSTQLPWLAIAAGLIVALGAATFWWLASRPHTALEALAATQAEERVTTVRVGDFPYAPQRPVVRSGAGPEPAYELLFEASRLQARAEESPTADTLHALGIVHLLLRRYDRAEAALEAAVEKASGDGPLTDRVQADLAAARLEWGIQYDEPRRIARAHDTLARLADEGNDPQILFNAALSAGALGLIDQAIAAWDRYLSADPDSPWAEEARRRRSELVAKKERTGASAEAVEDRVLLELLAAPAVPPGALNRAARLGAAYQRSYGDPWLSLTVARLRDAPPADRPGLEDLHRRYATARTAYLDARIVDCLSAVGEGDEVSAHAKSGTAHPVALALLLLQGSCSFLANEPSIAARLGGELSRLAAARDFPVLAGQGAWLAGLATHVENRVGEALRHLERSRELLARAGDIQRLASLETLRADLLRYTGRMDNAWRTGIGTLLHDGQEPARRHSALTVVGEIAVDDGLRWTRRDLLLEAVGLGPAVPASFRTDTWRNLGLVEGELGHHQAARAAFAAGVAVADSISDSSVRGRARALLDADHAAYLAPRDTAEAWRKLRSAEPFADSAAGLSYELALTRSRLALAAGNLAIAERSLVRALASIAAEIDQLDHLSDRAALLQVRGRLVRARVGLLVEQGREVDALQAVRAAGLKVLASPVVRASSVKAPTAQLASPPSPTLPGDLARITYFSLDDELLVWREADGQMVLRRVSIGRTELYRLVEDARSWMRSPGDGSGAAAAGRLAELLLEPGDLRWRRLVLVPDEVTAPLPFDGLPHPSVGGALGLHHFIMLAPASTGDLAAVPRPLGREPCIVLVEGAAGGDGIRPELGSLAYVDGELSSIAALYPCHRRVRSLEEVEDALHAGADIVHYAGHLLEGDGGGLLLAGDGQPEIVPLNRIETWPLQGAAVVLSACSGARVLPGTFGLGTPANAFLKAGASTVVASRWPVTDREALEMSLFLHRRNGRLADWPVARLEGQRQALTADEYRRRWAVWAVITNEAS